MSLVVVPLDKLVFGTHDMDWSHVQKLIDGTWIRPLLVEPLPDHPGYYYLADGRHRATALYELDSTFAICEDVTA